LGVGIDEITELVSRLLVVISNKQSSGGCQTPDKQINGQRDRNTEATNWRHE
jgi:hypothetical protein